MSRLNKKNRRLFDFQDCKKQRDQFYEIYRNWSEIRKASVEANGSSGANAKPAVNKRESSKLFEETFGDRIRKLLNLNTHPVNMLRFAQLFKEQLLTSCLSELLYSEGALQSSSAVIDPLKLKLLQSRCEALSGEMLEQGGPCPGKIIILDISAYISGNLHTVRNVSDFFPVSFPGPSFEGSQEFFHDFMMSCQHYSFLNYLRNELSESIEEKNEESFALSDKRAGERSTGRVMYEKSNLTSSFFLLKTY